MHAARQRDRQRTRFHRIRNRIEVTAFDQWCRFVEKGLGEGNDLGAAQRVERAVSAGAIFVRQDIGAVERVEQAAPARIRGVERIARVCEWHDQLRPGDAGDFVVNVFGTDVEVFAFGEQVADVDQVLLVGCGIVRLALALQVPRVDACLQFVAARQQRAVSRSEFAHDVGETLPHRVAAQPAARRDVVVHQIKERLGDLQAGYADAFAHRCIPVLSSPHCAGYPQQMLRCCRRVGRRETAWLRGWTTKCAG